MLNKISSTANFTPLDRPVWHTLTTRQRHTALALGKACQMQEDIGPWIATSDESDAAFEDFISMVSNSERAVLTFETGPVFAAHCDSADRQTLGVQMVFSGGAEDPCTDGIVPLGPEDAEQIYALACVAKPGPFARRTSELGGFVGIKKDGALIAMAGERLKLPGFTEISAVSVAPEFQGQGFGTQLVRHKVRQISQAGDVPFLHAYAGNTAAIRLYERLGFRLRTRMCVTRWAPEDVATFAGTRVFQMKTAARQSASVARAA